MYKKPKNYLDYKMGTGQSTNRNGNEGDNGRDLDKNNLTTGNSNLSDKNNSEEQTSLIARLFPPPKPYQPLVFRNSQTQENPPKEIMRKEKEEIMRENKEEDPEEEMTREEPEEDNDLKPVASSSSISSRFLASMKESSSSTAASSSSSSSSLDYQNLGQKPGQNLGQYKLHDSGRNLPGTRMVSPLSVSKSSLINRDNRNNSQVRMETNVEQKSDSIDDEPREYELAIAESEETSVIDNITEDNCIESSGKRSINVLSVDSSGNVERLIQSQTDKCYNRASSSAHQQSYNNVLEENKYLQQQLDILSQETHVVCAALAQTNNSTNSNNDSNSSNSNNDSNSSNISNISNISNRETEIKLSDSRISWKPFVYEDMYMARGNNTILKDNVYYCTVNLIGKPMASDLLIYPFGNDDCPLSVKPEKVKIEIWFDNLLYGIGTGNIDTEGWNPMCVVLDKVFIKDEFHDNNKVYTIGQLPIPIRFTFQL